MIVMIDINSIEYTFGLYGIKSIYSDPYFIIDIPNHQQRYNVYIDTLGFIIKIPQKNLDTIISMDLTNNSMEETIKEIIRSLDYLKHYKKVNKEILDFSVTSISNVIEDFSISEQTERIYHIIYKVDGIYQHRLVSFVDSLLDGLSIVFDINSRFAQICNYNLDYFTEYWWDVNYEIQPSRILYQVEIDKFINQPNYTSISIILLGVINKYLHYIHWSNYSGNHLHEDYEVDLPNICHLENCRVYCKEDVSPLVESIVEVRNKNLRRSVFKAVINKSSKFPTILKDLDPFGSRQSELTDFYEIYGIDNSQDVIRFINEVLYNDELRLKELIYTIAQIIHSKEYYYFTKSRPLIIAEIDYKTKNVKIKCSHYIYLGRKIDFILELIIEKDKAYYSIINLVKGNIDNIPIEDISGPKLKTICKEYVLGSYREISSEVLDIFETEV